MALILGKDGYNQLALGYPINVNDIKAKPFTVAQDEINGILPGDLLATTGTSQVYKKATSKDDKVVGIALATNVKLDPLFPQSKGEPAFEAGIQAAYIYQGEIAVTLSGAAPAEMDEVYYETAEGSEGFTNTSSATAIALPNMVFTGITEGNLTVVRVRY